MSSAIINLILGMAILMYMLFSGFTIYMVLVSKNKPDRNTDYIGRFLYWHGTSWMIGMVIVFALTLALIFASFIMNVINMRVIVG
jgi:hypothetical protein